MPNVGLWDSYAYKNSDGGDMADMNGDNLPDVFQAKINGSTFTSGVYLNGSKEELLSMVTTPNGGKVSITYKNTPLYLESGNLTNPILPFSLATVSSLTSNDGFGGYGTTTYSYSGGLYHYSSILDKKFAGFGKIIKTDEAGNVTKTYYHQGNTSDSSNGEYNDDISKMNKPYRIEQYDNSGNLYSLIVNKWDKYSITASSTFVKLTQTTEEDFDGNSSHKDKAEAYTYDNSTGNLSQKVTWWSDPRFGKSNNPSFCSSGKLLILT
ncbi:MAG: hypothetical protein NT098_01005 [Candidatus Parcubacteria bacterium]|nr:hypothetical protein [Candidatus Parcubacteria bacterium]